MFDATIQKMNMGPDEYTQKKFLGRQCDGKMAVSVTGKCDLSVSDQLLVQNGQILPVKSWSERDKSRQRLRHFAIGAPMFFFSRLLYTIAWILSTSRLKIFSNSRLNQLDLPFSVQFFTDLYIFIKCYKEKKKKISVLKQ